MKRDFADFHYVAPEQLAMHERLVNWSRYVADGKPHWPVSPMWRQYRSNARQWHPPIIREEVNTLDGHVLEKAVAALPPGHRDALRWCYVRCWWISPTQARRALGVTNEGLVRLIRDGRTMLIARCA